MLRSLNFVVIWYVSMHAAESRNSLLASYDILASYGILLIVVRSSYMVCDREVLIVDGSRK